jgi:hypothetical protein
VDYCKPLATQVEDPANGGNLEPWPFIIRITDIFRGAGQGYSGIIDDHVHSAESLPGRAGPLVNSFAVWHTQNRTGGCRLVAAALSHSLAQTLFINIG